MDNKKVADSSISGADWSALFLCYKRGRLAEKGIIKPFIEYQHIEIRNRKAVRNECLLIKKRVQVQVQS